MSLKNILFLLFAGMNLISISQEIKFKSMKENFGFAHEGDTVRISYELENTGDKPLLITGYEVECGCTVMQKPSAPVAPGEKYVLLVTFDTHEKYDRQDRTVKVISNALNTPSVLRFKGVVLKPKSKG
jgi:hypothetical protein